MSISTHMVAMRDGIGLATDVHMPDGTGPFPVIMERTPYGRHETSRSEITAANRTPATRAELATICRRPMSTHYGNSAKVDSLRKLTNSKEIGFLRSGHPALHCHRTFESAVRTQRKSSASVRPHDR
jgi:hypothetical protein